MNDRATFTRMEASTRNDWRKIGGDAVSEFEPLVRRVFAQPQNSIYKASTAVATHV